MKDEIIIYYLGEQSTSLEVRIEEDTAGLLRDKWQIYLKQQEII